MKKIIRNMSDPSSRAFWESTKRSASGVQQWPDWKKAGINVVQSGLPSNGQTVTSSRRGGGVGSTGE